MAKDDIERVERDEDLPFEIPKFDENEFVRKELISFRTTVILFVFSLAIAALTTYVERLTGLQFIFLLVFALACTGLLPFVYRLFRINISHFKRREWIGTLFLHFFFWMGFSLLISNPPVQDHAAPILEVGVSPAFQAAGQPVALEAYIADNHGLDEGTVEFCLTQVSSPSAAPMSFANLTQAQRASCGPAWIHTTDDPVWRTSLNTTTAGTYAWLVGASDDRGNHRELGGVVVIGDPNRIASPPRDNKFVVDDDVFKVCPRTAAPPTETGPATAVVAQVRVVQFRLDNDATWHNFVPYTDAENLGCWKTAAKYEGWTVGAHAMSVRTVYQPIFLTRGFRVPDGDTVPASNDPRSPYNITVDAGLQDVGTTKAAEVKENQYVGPQLTPGPSTGLLLMGGAGALVVAARTRRHG